MFFFHIYKYVLLIKSKLQTNPIKYLTLQPVGFVTFQTRAGAEAAKQDLQVNKLLIYYVTRDKNITSN